MKVKEWDRRTRKKREFFLYSVRKKVREREGGGAGATMACLKFSLLSKNLFLLYHGTKNHFPHNSVNFLHLGTQKLLKNLNR